MARFSLPETADKPKTPGLPWPSVECHTCSDTGGRFAAWH